MPELIRRTRDELSADFAFRSPLRISRSLGRLDVMGGIADYTGSLVCEAPLDRAAAIATQERSDRQLQIFSFNLYDEHVPFTFRVSLDALANATAGALCRDFGEPGRHWAAYLAGCLYVLHEQKLIDLRDPRVVGLNVALYSTIPMGAGVASSGAIEVAMMMNLADHFHLRSRAPLSDPVELAALCQQVENRVVGAPCGVMDQVTSCCGHAGTLLRLVCQPHELQPPLRLPEGIRVLGLDSGVKHSVGGVNYRRTRCAAFMGHSIILKAIRRAGAEKGYALESDPLRGYLANLDSDDYKSLFRPLLPEQMGGKAFLDEYGPTIDHATSVDPNETYHVRLATDHHVMEARRVRQFAQFMEEASRQPPKTREQGIWLDKAGHLMYASHRSYGECALLGAPETDLLVDLARQHEPAGLYGAKITGGGSGGTVAILADQTARADDAIEQIIREYERQTGRRPQAFRGTSDGAWQVGTMIMGG